MIEPTVGRIVWFRSLEHQTNEPLAAIITAVHHPRLVNICAFNPMGSPLARVNVPLWHGETQGDGTVEPRPAKSHCEWMPHQKGQAAKTEALEKQIASA
jgi:hypothetical protein